MSPEIPALDFHAYKNAPAYAVSVYQHLRDTYVCTYMDDNKLGTILHTQGLKQIEFKTQIYVHIAT